MIKFTMNSLCANEWFVFIEPVKDGRILLWIKFDLNSLKWFNVQYIVGVIEWRFFVIERWETHSLKMTTISLLTTHHHPHCPVQLQKKHELITIKCRSFTQSLLYYVDKKIFGNNKHDQTYPHCAMYTGSMTHGISLTNVIAPVM